MNIYKYNNHLFLFYKDDAGGHCVKVQTQPQTDWIAERLGGTFFGMLDNDPKHPSDESFKNKIESLWDEAERANTCTQAQLKELGYINISELAKQSARDTFSAVKETIEKGNKIEPQTNSEVLSQLFTLLADYAKMYDDTTGTDKYSVFILACQFMSADPTSPGMMMLNQLRTFAAYPNFLDANAVKSAPCGCGTGAMNSLLTNGYGLCDINTMWKSWMLNIIFWYFISPEFWLDIKPFAAVDGVPFAKIAELLGQLHLADYTGCSCKDLTNSYSITSADILRWLSLLNQLGDCPSNTTFMWRTLGIMIFSQLFSIIYIQNIRY